VLEQQKNVAPTVKPANQDMAMRVGHQKTQMCGSNTHERMQQFLQNGEDLKGTHTAYTHVQYSFF